jgi:hypothetical protein
VPPGRGQIAPMRNPLRLLRLAWPGLGSAPLVGARAGKRYDSKAVVGAAHGFLPGERPLAAGEFSGARQWSADCCEGSGSSFVLARR